MSSHSARRVHGVCSGSLWKQCESQSSDSMENIDRTRSFDYCVLLGVTLLSFTDYHCYKRGDHPVSVLRVVGASSWKPTSKGNSLQNEVTKLGSLQFRLVTVQGTHVYCTCLTPADARIWMESLHSALQRCYDDAVPQPPLLKPPSPPKSGRRGLFGRRESTVACQSCGRVSEAVRDPVTPLPQYGFEQKCVVCGECLVAQGVWWNTQWAIELYSSFKYEKNAFKKSQKEIQNIIWKGEEPGRAEELIVSQEQGTELMTKLKSPGFENLRRHCPKLQKLCKQYEQGQIHVLDFLETVLEQDPTSELNNLKQQAFRVAGDMGSAMKLLSDCAGDSTQSLDMWRFLLEFFLDLCEEGDIQSVSFFWPQLQAIHFQLLPPTNHHELEKVELLQDFLLTVVTTYSVQLSLDLIWSCVADLEESLLNPHASSSCRYRRFSVLRFVCELESLLFDFSDGWGGGSVSLRNMLSPSPHQVAILRDAVLKLQAVRRNQDNFALSRSTRMDKLKQAKFHKPPEVAAQDALKAAKHADYFSSHLSFTRRLCDIAEKLRFLEIEYRRPMLEKELTLLNASGGMGGDPLNRVAKDNLTRVVRIPVTEGHVFRSKERTPVLLLMELVEEGHDKLTGYVDDQEVPKTPDAVPTLESSNGRRAGDYAVDLEMPPDGLQGTATDSEEEKVAVDEEGDDHLEALQSSSRSFDSRRAFSNDGAKESMTESPVPRALATFNREDDKTKAAPEIPKTPSKNSMEKLITSVMIEQLNMPDLEGNDDSKEEDDTEELNGDDGRNDTPKLNKIGGGGDGTDIRRDVLTAIMTKGMAGKNDMAATLTKAAQKSLQQLDRKRAVDFLLSDEAPEPKPRYTPPGSEERIEKEEEQRKRLVALGLEDAAIHDQLSDEPQAPPSEEDEAIESLRLLLIQNQVALGNMTPEAAAKATAIKTSSLRNMSASPNAPIDKSDIIEIDAGDVDPRLKGCGTLPPAVLSALTLWKGEVISLGELLELVKKDIQFTQTVDLAEVILQEESAFWGRFAFGERWAEKKARIAATSPQGSVPGWDLTGIIVKSNDDLRQEAFVMQLIELSHEAFQAAGLDLWLNPYRILATGRTTGIIEMVRNAMSLDALKKRPGYGKGGLREHLKRMSEFTTNPTESFRAAQANFVRSLSAYSLLSYFFLFKDRHNGNILVDTAGHVIHIDFGFVFGIAPGGSFSLEMSTPFKLTEEMMQVMGGMGSPVFSEFVTQFCCGFLALQAHMDTFLTIVEITSKGSPFKCFEGRDPTDVVAGLRQRFCPDLNKEQTVAFALDLIKHATQSYGTKQYDYFQYLSQGIAT